MKATPRVVLCHQVCMRHVSFYLTLPPSIATAAAAEVDGERSKG